MSLKSIEFFSNPQPSPYSFQGNVSNITTPPPPATKMEIEQKVLANVSKYNEKQLQNQQNQVGTTEAKPKMAKKMKLNASFQITETKEEKSDWDKPIPKVPSTSSKQPLPQMKKPVVPPKNPSNIKPSLNSGSFQVKDFPDELEKIEEDAKKEEDHEKELKEKKEKEEKERLERERLEKERIENERLEKERVERERVENERLEKEKLEKERIENERLEKEKNEKDRLEKERIEKEKLERELKEKEEKQQRNHENIGTSVIQKGQNKITKQYLINLIEVFFI